MTEIHHLGETESLFNQYIAEIRDVRIQTDRMRFRRNIERIGEIFAYGLRNVQHIAWDTATGRMYVTDIGQS
ncbi:MAG: hypothetical protein ABGY96_14725, partial [bacterium]